MRILDEKRAGKQSYRIFRSRRCGEPVVLGSEASGEFSLMMVLITRLEYPRTMISITGDAVRKHSRMFNESTPFLA